MSEHVAREAHGLAIRLAKGFELAGTLAIELFITKDDRVIVNELARARNNSGHYTIEGLLDGPVRRIHPRHRRLAYAKPKLLSPAVMVNVLGQHVEPTRALIATTRVERARLRQGRSAPRPQDGPTSPCSPTTRPRRSLTLRPPAAGTT